MSDRHTPEPILSASAFRILAIAERGGHHVAFTEAARRWLQWCGQSDGFVVDCIAETDGVTEALLGQYRLILQLDYVPYGWSPGAMAAFRSYIEEGRGGWVGLHHAGLLGDFDGFQVWPWFQAFMGGIRYQNYIPTFASGTVCVEDAAHPCMRDVPASFPIDREEWYTWEVSPRAHVRVLASVDESTYRPESSVRMGDHPVVWTNERVAARNVYIYMGHGPELLDNAAYTLLLRNAIRWAAGAR